MKDIVGKRFGKLVVLGKVDAGKYQYKSLCLCDCGNTVASDGDVWGITNNFLFKDCTETHGKTGKLIFEWEE